MGSEYFTNPITFLINTFFDLYILAIMLRFVLQVVRADFYNPVSQFLVKITNPPLKPLRRILPGLGGIDIASIVLMLLLTIIKLVMITTISGRAIAAGPIFIISIAELVQLTIYLYFFTILIQIILSWIGTNQYNPAVSLLHQINEPILRPARNIIPPIGGIDFSPMIVIILLQVLLMLVIPPILMLAR